MRGIVSRDGKIAEQVSFREVGGSSDRQHVSDGGRLHQRAARRGDAQSILGCEDTCDDGRGEIAETVTHHRRGNTPQRC